MVILVVVANGRLGVMTSSARYKRDIHDIGPDSANLMKLRPVSFRYKDDPQAIKQYGLVAEEVEQLYPELVTRGADGKIQSVRYTVLVSMLLNELQKQAEQSQHMAAQMANTNREIKSLRAMFERRFASYKRQPDQQPERPRGSCRPRSGKASGLSDERGEARDQFSSSSSSSGQLHRLIRWCRTVRSLPLSPTAIKEPAPEPLPPRAGR